MAEHQAKRCNPDTTRVYGAEPISISRPSHRNEAAGHRRGELEAVDSPVAAPFATATTAAATPSTAGIPDMAEQSPALPRPAAKHLSGALRKKGSIKKEE